MNSKVAEHSMDLIKSGKIRHHKLLDSGCPKSNYELKIEAQIFEDFLQSKLAYQIYCLEGSDNL